MVATSQTLCCLVPPLNMRLSNTFYSQLVQRQRGFRCYIKVQKYPFFLQKIGNNDVGRNCRILVSGQLTAHLHHSWKVQVIFHSSGSAQIRLISRSQTFLVVTDQNRPFAVYWISLINSWELWANTTSEGVNYLRGSTKLWAFELHTVGFGQGEVSLPARKVRSRCISA
jgi:hypothetical protein